MTAGPGTEARQAWARPVIKALGVAGDAEKVQSIIETVSNNIAYGPS